MIRWNVRKQMEERGWSNANQLAAGAGMTKPAAYRVFAGEPLDRIDVATLERLARVFKCSPWSLLDYKPG
jgi:DNA-binding Xre family transcriptional regulator